MTARQAGEGPAFAKLASAGEGRAAKVVRKPLSEEELARIERAFSAVLHDPPMFSSFQVEFTTSNVGRMETYGKWAFWSAKRWEVIEGIEKRMEELG